MPNIKSAKKRVKVIETKTMHNKAAKSALKTILKKADAACAENAADKETAVKVAIKKIDQAAAKGLTKTVLREKNHSMLQNLMRKIKKESHKKFPVAIFLHKKSPYNM